MPRNRRPVLTTGHFFPTVTVFGLFLPHRPTAERRRDRLQFLIDTYAHPKLVTPPRYRSALARRVGRPKRERRRRVVYRDGLSAQIQ